VCLYLFGLVGLFSAGRSYAAVFGVFFGLMELIPFVGPVLGAIPPVLVALFQDPVTAVWVVVLFVGLQQLEGHIVAPQIFGHALRINPLLVIFALTVGGSIYGVVGALIALPVAAVIRETAIYLQRHVMLEQWEVQRPAWLGGGGGGRGGPGGVGDASGAGGATGVGTGAGSRGSAPVVAPESGRAAPPESGDGTPGATGDRSPAPPGETSPAAAGDRSPAPSRGEGASPGAG
jgi:hypothetical protein